MTRGFFYTLISVFILLSCSEKKNKEDHQVKEVASKLELKYAKGFGINHFDNHTELLVMHPENGELIQTIIISDTSRIKLNITSVFSASTTHLAYIDALGENTKVKGFVNKDYIFNSTYLKQFESEVTIDIGYGEEIDLEKIISNKPDAFLISGLLGKAPQFEKIEQMGIPLIEIVEWAEIHPLARAEWIKFYGVLFNKEKEADSIFNEIESNYKNLLSKTQKLDSTSKPLVLTGSSYKGTWYLPGGKNFSSLLMTHAGGNYPFFRTSYTSESLPYSMESVAAEFLDADIWLRPGAKSLEGLAAEDSRYEKFNAFKTGEVYEVNKRTLPSGANDYWETALVRPDMLLKDLIKIFHPELFPDYELYFYQKLE